VVALEPRILLLASISNPRQQSAKPRIFNEIPSSFDAVKQQTPQHEVELNAVAPRA
jgi:hypothetical protein